MRGLPDQPSFKEVRKIISKTVQMYQEGLFDELYVCYNHHVNSFDQPNAGGTDASNIDLDPNGSR